MERQIPLYLQLKDYIRQEIKRQKLAPSDPLPSQRELEKRFGMSHMTVRRSISELINEGVIYAIPGKGLYVSDQKRLVESGPLSSFTEDTLNHGLHPSSQVIASEVVPASTMTACSLNVPPGTPLAYLYRMRLINDEPICLQWVYLVHAFCPGVLEHDFNHESLYATLRDVYHLKLVGSKTTVEASLAEPYHADLLKVRQPAAVLVTEQVTYLDNGQAVETARSIYRGGRYLLHFEQ